MVNLKSDSHLQKNCFICFNESLSKMMTNTFYFILKAFFRSDDLNFCLDFFAHAENSGLVRQKMFISKFMASQPD